MESSLTTLNTKVLTLGIAGLVTSLSAGVTAADSTAVSPWGFDPPAGWVAPSLDPRGVQLETRQLVTGVYALLSNKPPVDNSGFVVGERGVLVIDAHFNGDMARQIQEAVRAVTDKPILYLVNTNYHGDHTFGNYAFPAETTIIAHKKTARAMQDFEQEKKIMLATVGGDKTIFGDATLRLPDVEFEDSLRIDLGKRVVELYNFGHGNTAGDTVVYVPEAKVAWTGNLVLGTDTIPWGIEGDLQAYLQTITRFATTLDVETIVPGHVLTTDGRVLSTYLEYLSDLLTAVREALRSGHSLEETLARLPLDEKFLPGSESPLAAARPLMAGFHRWNVKKAYIELDEQPNVALQ